MTSGDTDLLCSCSPPWKVCLACWSKLPLAEQEAARQRAGVRTGSNWTVRTWADRRTAAGHRRR